MDSNKDVQTNHKDEELEKPVTVPVFVHELDPSRAPWGLCPMCGLADTRCWCGYVESNNEGVR